MKRSGNGTAFVERARYLDKEGRASTPLFFICVTFFLCRGYLAGIVSLTFNEDRTRLLSLFYKSSEQFGLMLVVGLPALCVLLATSFAKEDGYNWANQLMRVSQPLMFASLALDAILIASLLLHEHGSFSWGKASIILIWFISVWYVSKSRQWRFYRRHLAEKPEESVPEDTDKAV
ncbi:hypothetical protein DFP83_10793 [Idiomarina fontislapidosi]|uniref:DUF2919 domain-containing protein n=1 Tax=Idiomarina fontislapidosi TaxID=263723 RepID=A0A432XX63_9GAMM|nr:DUF2919 family protein [Idiomarina fontislapidosi]PYE32082.1 hypothetical protein DFP83_10793 [Idiomarina fontislapidosi]RUO53287.1 hypothetical protein CWE25_08665 [Idiomarina fontislapidosi]